MSAIAGALHLHGNHRHDGMALVRRMLASMSHRCDRAGTVIHTPADGTVLGELSAHPAASAAPGAKALAVIDGEIYNARALRHGLDLVGGPLGDSLGELVQHGFALYGLDFLAQMHGRFAVALWSSDERRLLLARDRLGEKPLYHMIVDGLLLFASELRALLGAARIRPRLDAVALHQYLTLGFVPSPRTLFTDVRKLAPGEVMVAGHWYKPRRAAWWRRGGDDDKAARIRALSPEQHRTNIRTLVESAVADRVSDGPVSVVVDERPESHLVAVLASRLLGGLVDAVRCGAAPLPRAAAVRAQQLDLPPLATCFPEATRHLDEPAADPQAVITWMTARAVAGRGTAALGADGFDETGLGAGGSARRWWQPAFVSRGRLRSPPELFGSDDIADLYHGPTAAPRRGRAPDAVAPHATTERLLMRLSHGAMSSAVEMRLPFLDHHLVDYVAAVPARVRRSQPSLLSQAFADILPAAAPVAATDSLAEGFRGSLGEVYWQVIGRSRLIDAAGFAPHRCLGLLDSHRRGTNHSRRLWALLVLADWIDRHWPAGGVAPAKDSPPLHAGAP